MEQKPEIPHLEESAIDGRILNLVLKRAGAEDT
jgi:hypothetical protein